MIAGSGLLPSAAAQTDNNGQTQKPPPPAVQQLLRLTPEQFIRRFDRNRDGYLTRDELPPRLASQFEKLDTNGDGKLDKKEVDELMQILRRHFGMSANKNNPAPFDQGAQQLAARMLQKMDANHDGKISREEAQGPLARIFDQLDLNKDGFLDRRELDRAAARLQGQMGKKGPGKGAGGKEMAQAMRIPDFDALDRNADGRLTREEVKGSALADIFDQIDSNKDGKIDRDEFDEYWKKKLAEETPEKKP
jgi:Ca2+-binding EF-hand superfamily protein